MRRDELMLCLRNDFSNHIREFYIKDECEHCKSTENLHVHHKLFFIDQFKFALELLKIEDKEEYAEEEVRIIRYMMLGVQCKNNDYVTLCDECHKHYHIRERGESIEKIYKSYINGERKIIIDEIYLNKWLTNEELQCICDRFNIKNSQGKNIGLRSFDKVLDNSGYFITKSRRKINNEKQLYYMIEKKRRGRKPKNTFKRKK